MVATLFADPVKAAFVRPAPLPGGVEPEERIIVCSIGWQGYLALDKALGDDRSGPRLYFHDSNLEIMSTSSEHERIKKWIASLVEVYFEENEIENMPRGQATMTLLEETGAEPDESWCIGEEGLWPDIVLEIALTSGGLDKLQIYRRFGVREVWIWRRDKLEVHALRDGEYVQQTASTVLPGLNIALIERCVAIPRWLEARREFRAGLR